jgi:hypothetical protein
MKSGSTSPVKDPPLRLPGQSLTEQEPQRLTAEDRKLVAFHGSRFIRGVERSTLR